MRVTDAVAQKTDWVSRAAWALVAIGVVLRVARWAWDRSIWWDEAALAMNVLERSFGELAEPLRFAQTGGIGFLWISKAMTLMFGESTLCLRFVPMAAAAASVVLFYFLARRLLDGISLVAAVGLFALNPWLIAYASEFKQYSIDVLLAVLVTWLALRGDWRATAVVGIVGAWVSLSSVFVSAGVTAAIIAHSKQRKVAVISGVGLIALAASAAAHYLLTELSARAHVYLQRHWASAFAPRDDLTWYGERLLTAMRDPCGVMLTWVALVMLLVGVAVLIRRSREHALVVLLPAAAAFVAALAGVYPLVMRLPEEVVHPSGGRLVMFLVPLACVVMGCGAVVLRRGLNVVIVLALVGPMGWTGVAALIEPPRFQEFREVWRGLQSKAQPGDVVYLDQYAQSVRNYYERVLGPVDGAEVVVCMNQRDEAGHAAQIARELGEAERIWVTFTHHPTTRLKAQEAMVLRALARVGRRGDEIELVGARGVLVVREDAGDPGAAAR